MFVRAGQRLVNVDQIAHIQFEPERETIIIAMVGAGNIEFHGDEAIALRRYFAPNNSTPTCGPIVQLPQDLASPGARG